MRNKRGFRYVFFNNVPQIGSLMSGLMVIIIQKIKGDLLTFARLTR